MRHGLLAPEESSGSFTFPNPATPMDKVSQRSRGAEEKMTPSNPRGAQDLPVDPYAGDPFFRSHLSSTWNACIGEQGDEENYIDGYIEAAMELANSVVDKQMFGKRDTLVLPILYNARHAVELVLKFVTVRLAIAELIPPSRRANHNISRYLLEILRTAELGDEQLRKQFQSLKPYVDSLSRIDRDGQELRYHLNRFDDPSLSDYSLANLEVIRESLSELAEIISILKNRVIRFIDERRTGVFTRRCSRRDLLAIAQAVPRRESWNSALFSKQKVSIKTRYGLSSRGFSDALDAIQTNREMKAIIGIESDLMYITDEEIMWMVEQWRLIHPRREGSGGVIKSLTFDDASLKAMKEERELRKKVIAEVEKKIAGDKLAEIEAIFYLGRDGIFAEHYEVYVERKKKEHAAANDPKSKIVHLLNKTNFLHSVHIAMQKLGRLSLSTNLGVL